MQKAAKETLSDIFFDGFEEAISGFKNAYYYFIEGVLKEILAKSSLEEKFKRNLERWTQSSSFMNAFT